MNLAGGLAYGRYWVKLPNTAYALTQLGPMERSDTNFARDFMIETTVGAPGLEVETTLTGIFPLGQLAPGNYALSANSYGRKIATWLFAMPDAD